MALQSAAMPYTTYPLLEKKNTKHEEKKKKTVVCPLLPNVVLQLLRRLLVTGASSHAGFASRQIK